MFNSRSKGGKIVKIADELFEMYKGKVSGTEEELAIITLTILEQFNREDLMQLVEEMDENELKYYIQLCISETLKMKFSGENKTPLSYDRFVH
jgi:hypothetical protein